MGAQGTFARFEAARAAITPADGVVASDRETQENDDVQRKEHEKYLKRQNKVRCRW